MKRAGSHCEVVTCFFPVFGTSLVETQYLASPFLRLHSCVSILANPFVSMLYFNLIPQSCISNFFMSSILYLSIICCLL